MRLRTPYRIKNPKSIPEIGLDNSAFPNQDFALERNLSMRETSLDAIVMGPATRIYRINDRAIEPNCQGDRTGGPSMRGWLNYFTAFYPSAVIPIGKRVDRHLMRWARWKYKRLERSEDRTRTWLKGVRQRSPDLFAHWTPRYTT